MKVMISNGSVPALFQARFIVAIGREAAEAAPGPPGQAPLALHVLLLRPRRGPQPAAAQASSSTRGSRCWARP
jgi:hypothetical protein